MEKPPEQVLEAISAIEELAEDMLSERQHIIDLDRKRQKTREAIRVFHKDKLMEKKWVCFGNMFIKMPKQQTMQLLDKEFDKLDEEISSTRSGLKTKVNKLRDLEHKEHTKGFQLTALSKEEMESLKAVL